MDLDLEDEAAKSSTEGKMGAAISVPESSHDGKLNHAAEGNLYTFEDLIPDSSANNSTEGTMGGPISVPESLDEGKLYYAEGNICAVEDLIPDAAENSSIERSMGGAISVPGSLDEGILNNAEGDICSVEEDSIPDRNISAKEVSSLHEGDAITEPYVGMEFDSEDAAKNFYNEYARRLGFVVRLMQGRRSPNGELIARKLGCNKEGFSFNQNSASRPDKKPRPPARVGCNAAILVRMGNSGKWVVTKFVKEHTHLLVPTVRKFSTIVDKDRKIEELTWALRYEEKLCAAYRENLLSLMAIVEAQTEQLSSKVLQVVENIKNVEAEGKTSKS